MVTLRGFARYPKIDTMQEVYGQIVTWAQH